LSEGARRKSDEDGEHRKEYSEASLRTS